MVPSWSRSRLTRLISVGRILGVVHTFRRHRYPTLYRLDYQRLRDLYVVKGLTPPAWLPTYEEIPAPEDAAQLLMRAETDIAESLPKMSRDREPERIRDVEPLPKMSTVTAQNEQGQPYIHRELNIDTDKTSLGSTTSRSSEEPIILGGVEIDPKSFFVDRLLWLLPREAVALGNARILLGLEREAGYYFAEAWADYLWDQAAEAERPLGLMTASLRKLIASGMDLAEPPERRERSRGLF